MPRFHRQTGSCPRAARRGLALTALGHPGRDYLATWLGMGWCSSWYRTFQTEVSSWRAMAGTVSPDTMSSWTAFGSSASGGVPGRVKPSRRVSGGSQVGGSSKRPCARRKSTATVLSLSVSCGVRVLLIRSVHTPRQCNAGCELGTGAPLSCSTSHSRTAVAVVAVVPAPCSATRSTQCASGSRSS
jgi:hypothetical protein